MKLIVIAAALLIATAARADAPSLFDTALLVAAETSIAMDGLQTLDIQRCWPRCEEENVLLGSHPSQAAIGGYFGGAMLLTAVAWYAMPPRFRVLVPIAVLAIEVPVVERNAHLGASFALRF